MKVTQEHPRVEWMPMAREHHVARLSVQDSLHLRESLTDALPFALCPSCR